MKRGFKFDEELANVQVPNVVTNEVGILICIILKYQIMYSFFHLDNNLDIRYSIKTLENIQPLV
jgi:hypothetical protein